MQFLIWLRWSGCPHKGRSPISDPCGMPKDLWGRYQTPGYPWVWMRLRSPSVGSSLSLPCEYVSEGECRQYITFMLQLVNHFVTLKKQEDRTPSVISHFSCRNLLVYTQSMIFWRSSAGLSLASPAVFLQEPYLSHHPCIQTVLFSQLFPPQLHFFLFINTQHAGSERSRASCLSHWTSCLANILWSDALTLWISHVGSPSMNLKLLLSNLTGESHCDVLQTSFAEARITSALDNDGPVCSWNRIFRSTFSHVWTPCDFCHRTSAVGSPSPCHSRARSSQ